MSMSFIKRFKMHLGNKQMFLSCLIIAVLLQGISVITGGITLLALPLVIIPNALCTQLLLALFYSLTKEDKKTIYFPKRG